MFTWHAPDTRVLEKLRRFPQRQQSGTFCRVVGDSRSLRYLLPPAEGRDAAIREASALTTNHLQKSRT